MNIKKIIAYILSAVFIISAFPVMTEARGSGTEIVFAIDTSASMSRYDIADGIADSLSGIVEQAKNATGFGLVTAGKSVPVTDSSTIIDELYSIPDNDGICSISSLTDTASELFSSNSNKILFVVTDKWEDISVPDGITVYPILFTADEKNSDNIKKHLKNAVICSAATELTYKLADTYEQMLDIAPEPGRLSIAGSGTISYNSSFRYGKHNYGEDITSYKKGAALAALLNMYYMLPASVSGAYSINDEPTVRNIGNGITNGIFSDNDKKELLSFWNIKSRSTLSAAAYAKASENGVSETQSRIIEDNIKRRFPILIWSGSSAGDANGDVYLITGLDISENDTIYHLYSPSADHDADIYIPVSGFDGRYIRVLDTQKYFNTIYSTHSVKTILDGSNVSLTLPSDYDGKILKYLHTDNNVTTIESNDASASFSILSGEEFTVRMDVKWQGLFPDIHNSVLNFRILLFDDVTAGFWARSYIFNMTNRKIINGRDDNTFAPDDKTTIAEYLAMTIRAGDIVNPSGKDWDTDFPSQYINYAIDKDLITAGTDYNAPVSRELAFNITWKVLTSDECRTPTQLVEYDKDLALSSMEFTDEDQIAWYCIDSIAQLSKNGIITGYPDKKLGPGDAINRAEAATTLAKCISRFDDGKEIISVNNGNQYEYLTHIPLDTRISGVIGDYKSMSFTFFTDVTGLYPITAEGKNIKISVHEPYESDGTTKYRECYPKAGKSTIQYPLEWKKDMVVTVSGKPGTEFTLEVSSAVSGSTSQPDGKVAYITFYDSPIKRYLDSQGVTYDGVPTPEQWDGYHRYDVAGNNAFFESYLNAVGDDITPVFVLTIRDADFNAKRKDGADDVDQIGNSGVFRYKNAEQKTNIQFQGGFAFDVTDEKCLKVTGMTFDQYKKLVIETSSDEIVNIMTGFKNAAQKLGKDMPLFCIGMPTCDPGVTQDKKDFSEKFYDMCIGTNETKGIYYRVLDKMHDAGISPECIEGIYNGWEDATTIYDDKGEYTAGYLLLKKVAIFAHKNNKKFLWAPYASIEKISEFTNKGVYVDDEKDKDGNLIGDMLTHDMFDTVVSQANLFFDDDYRTVVDEDHKVSLEYINENVNANNDRLKTKLFNIYHSIKEGKAIINSTGFEDSKKGIVAEGGKFTDTNFSVELEYDIGLITGRWYDGKDPSFSKQKAQNFLFVLDAFRSFLYGDAPWRFSIYSGGMNEQAYDLAAAGAENNNRHSIINHQTALAVRTDGKKYLDNDIGNGKPYNWFFDYISELYAISDSDTDEIVQDKLQKLYNTNFCPNNIVYDITVGIMQNKWSPEAREFLAIPDGMLCCSNDGTPLLYDGYYKVSPEGFYYNY